MARRQGRGGALVAGRRGELGRTAPPLSCHEQEVVCCPTLVLCRSLVARWACMQISAGPAGGLGTGMAWLGTTGWLYGGGVGCWLSGSAWALLGGSMGGRVLSASGVWLGAALQFAGLGLGGLDHQTVTRWPSAGGGHRCLL